MVDSLATVEVTVLNEGVKFIFAQLTDLLKGLRERRDQKRGVSSAATAEVAVTVESSDALAGVLKPGTVRVDDLVSLEPRMRELRRLLADYADGIESVDPQDGEILALVREARRVLELIFGQQIIFRGEQASVSAASVDVDVRAGEVEGYLAGVRARRFSPGTNVTARVVADAVRHGGTVIGVDAESI